MKWLNKVADELTRAHPDGELIVSSGVTPSGKYHIGTLREILTAEAIRRELELRGRQSRHIHVVDDFDVFRKVPADIPAEFEKHLGKPLFLVPSPDDSQQNYADYFVKDLHIIIAKLGLKSEVISAREKYQEGTYSQAIEKTLGNIDKITGILADISGHKLDENWSPVQVMEGEYLKTRKFSSLNKEAKTLEYIDHEGQIKTASYAKGEVKLNWRIDWPARWWMLGVDVEPFGRDHATKGGSYDTGSEIVRQIFDSEAPRPVPYHFINRTGETKKISKSAGNVVTAAGLLEIMPPEVLWYFMLRYAPNKQLFFDEGNSLVKLFDDLAGLLDKPDKADDEQHLLDICLWGIEEQTISSVPFSHLVASYQAGLKDADRALEIIKRTEYKQQAETQADVIRREFHFIDKWLEEHAPDEVKFTVEKDLPKVELTEQQARLLDGLAEAIEKMEPGQDGQWFHERIYEQKDSHDLSPAESFQAVYRVILNQDRGPQAGWFLAALDRDWLIMRLRRQA